MTVYHLTGPVVTAVDAEAPEAWVVDGRITYEQPPAALDAVDLPGWVVPGLADLHCHLGLETDGASSREDALVQGATVRDLGVLLVRDAGSPQDTRMVQEEPFMPRLIRAGQHIARTRRYLRNYGVEIEPGQLAEEAARQCEAGDGWVKIVADWIDRDLGDLSPTFPEWALRDAAAVVHERGGRLTAHTFSEETLPLLLDAGFDCLEHATGMDDTTIARIADAGIPVVPTLVNVDNFEEYAKQGEGKFPAYAAHMRSLRERRFRTIGAAHDAGITLLPGTDSGGVLPHGIYHEELAEMRRAGLTDAEVLDAATFAARAFLGVPALDEGAPADLLVADEDPRRDITVLRDVRHIVLGGRLVR